MNSEDVPVINLSEAPGERQAWDRPIWHVYVWSLFELVFITNPLQISSALRVRVLRRFGAEIGEKVILRPRLRVKFPWKLTIGSRSWIGEGVWIHNQDRMTIGEDVVISQDSFLTTGTHAYRSDMALKTRPVEIEHGAWVTSRCIILAGTHIGRSALILPNTVVRGDVPEGVIFGNPEATVVGRRFSEQATAGPVDAAPF